MRDSSLESRRDSLSGIRTITRLNVRGFSESKLHTLDFDVLLPVSSYPKGKKEKVCWVDLCIHIARQVPVLRPDNKLLPPNLTVCPVLWQYLYLI